MSTTAPPPQPGEELRLRSADTLLDLTFAPEPLTELRRGTIVKATGIVTADRVHVETAQGHGWIALDAVADRAFDHPTGEQA